MNRPPRQQNGGDRREAVQEEEPRAQVLPGDEVERDEVVQEDLPGDHQENQQLIWKGLEGENVERWVEETYQEIVKWDPFNLFTPPMCAATKDLITEMTCLLNNYNVDSILAPLALKILFLMPKLLLQQTHEKAKGRENTAALSRRMAMWQRGEINELLSEARALQERRRDHTNKPKQSEEIARTFGKLMRSGKVAAATRSLSEEAASGVLPINRETIELLKDKHPQANNQEGIRLPGEYIPPNAVIFERITGALIWKKSTKDYTGGAGPSGMNANSWRVLLHTAKLKDKAQGLRNAIAILTKKLATSPCHHTQALTANRLVPFKKTPRRMQTHWDWRGI